MTRILEVFGPGCAKCKALKKSTEEAVEKLGWQDVEILYNTDMGEVIQRGITATPALAIDGKIVLSGQYLPTNKLVQLLQEIV
ncbi:MAG: TM0996/MTH895 family glutaredoxin-like protein [Candidatus Heimdallarchaeota archaeon]|nr:MAG: TM0996/MTH895 family glutaredoxin-like protein [Candidatus Heimdallarchaeota archaeon]